MPGRPLRVAVYTDSVEVGGAEISASHLVRDLSSDTTVMVLGVHRGVVDRVAAGRPSAVVEVVRRPRSPWDVRAIGAHARAFRRFGPDVVHLNLVSPWSCQHALAACVALPRTPVVAVYQLVVPPVNRRQRWLKRLSSNRISVHVAVGTTAAREVEEMVGLRAGTVRTVHNAVPAWSPASSTKTSDEPTVISVGRLEHQKGFDVLVDAFARLTAGRLLVVGEGGERTALQARVSRLGLDGRIRFLGWADDPRELLADADVFALASRFEGFPLAIVEAMIAGLPVVATDVGSVREAVVPNETGLLVAPDDVDGLAAALQELLSDDAKREAFGRAGRRRAIERFTAEQMARAYEDLYHELAG